MNHTELFGTSGVRGVTNKDITPDLAMGLGAAVGSFFGPNKKGCVARDTRKNADILKTAAASGLISQGIAVTDCGCVSTPAFAHYVMTTDADCGIMVTGSHLPSGMIGIIPFLGDGTYVPDMYATEIEDIFWHNKYNTMTYTDKKLENIKKAENVSISYGKKMISLINTKVIRKNEYKIAVDPANGTGSMLSPLLGATGCTLKEIHGEPKEIPERNPEPRANTLTELKKVVSEGEYTMGVGLDTDADRVVFIDEHGVPVSEDVAGVIFADYVFLGEEKGFFVTPVNSSGIVEWFSQSRDVVIQYCKIGQPATMHTIKQIGAHYAYEESGKYYFAEEVNWCDGMLSTLVMLEILAKGEMTLSEIVDFYPEFYQVKEVVGLPKEKKNKVMSVIGETVLDALGENTAQLITIDGYKLVYPDHSWLLLRASGTEPVLRVYSDSLSEERAHSLVKKGLEYSSDIIEDT
ncbi:MAG: hypothetical protein PVF58_11540 [Candidatus Methanofastidiosia archaeon]|jgi:phosphomannomutase/phosphoglucomutase